MRAAKVVPWVRPHRSWKSETWNMVTAVGTGLAIGALIGGRKGATMGAVSGGYGRWMRWWGSR